MDASNGKLISETVGEIEVDSGVLVIRRIHVAYKLRAPESARGTIERVHNLHAERCPVARSLRAAIEISTALELIPE